jgi:hypothetical protein
MARLASVVAAGGPHHPMQRGNRRRHAFFRENDGAPGAALPAEGCRAA